MGDEALWRGWDGTTRCVGLFGRIRDWVRLRLGAVRLQGRVRSRLGVKMIRLVISGCAGRDALTRGEAAEATREERGRPGALASRHSSPAPRFSPPSAPSALAVHTG